MASIHPPRRLLWLWQRVPAIACAAVVAELICDLGGLPAYLLMLGNLKLWPAIPIFLPLSALWLWLFWQYLDGRGWPRSTSTARHEALRARPLGRDAWRWSLVAGGLGMVSVVALAFVTSRLANLPRDAYKLSLNVGAFPVWTQVSILLVISLSAGVVEESAFRGYALSLIERRHGWVIGILLTGIMFFLTHLGHAYVTLAFLPFFLGVSALHGLLVYFTRSILPSVVLHATADFIFIPIQYGLIGNLSVTPVSTTGIDAAFVIYVCTALLFAAIAIPAFRRLARIREKTSALQPDQGGHSIGQAAGSSTRRST